MVPTVNVLSAFSATVSGESGSLVFSPASAIFAGIGVFLLAAKDVGTSEEFLTEFFERMELLFQQLEAYTEPIPAAAIPDIITKIMLETLKIFGIATRELRRGSAKKFLMKLARRTDLEDALEKLRRLVQEVARMTAAEELRVAHSVGGEIIVVDGKVGGVQDKVEDWVTE